MLMPINAVSIVLLAEKSEADKLFGALLMSNSYQPSEPGQEYDGAFEPAYSKILYETEIRLNKLKEYLKEIEEYDLTYEVSMQVKSWLEVAKNVLDESSKIEKFLDPIYSEIARSKAIKDRMLKYLSILIPFKEIDVNLNELRSSSRFSFRMFKLPSSKLDDLKKVLANLDYVVHFEKKNDETFVFLFFKKEDEKLFDKVISEVNGIEIEIDPNLPQNPMEAYEYVSRIIREQEQRMESLKSEIRGKKDELKATYSKLATIREAMRIASLAKFSRYFVISRGFVLSKDLEKLKNLLDELLAGKYVLLQAGISKAIEIEGKRPSTLSIPKLLQPFAMWVEKYGHPKASEISPVVFLAFTFPLIFGLMFPDAGHALLIILFGIILIKKSKGRKDWENTGLLAIYLGIASMITGLLSGEFFGPLTDFSQLLWNGHPILPSPFEAGAESIFLVVNISLKLGASLLVFGTFLGVLNSYLEKDYFEMIALKIPKFTAFLFALHPFIIYNASYAGAIVKNAVFGGAETLESELVKYGVIISLLTILAFDPLFHAIKEGKKNMGTVFISSFMEVFETGLMLVGNTASFLRILGLAVAHAGVMYSFTVLAQLVWKGTLGAILGIIIYIIGNLLAAGLEGIIVFAHTLRLHYYEWFTKFYSGAGMPFMPAKALAKIIII